MSNAPSRAPGVLMLVVGPSGAGKDALIAAARSAHEVGGKITFARRVITRDALPGAEDHDTLPLDAFEAAEAAGFFALSWRAHGLAYGISISVLADLKRGVSVMANVSRGVIAEAEALGVPVAVLHVTAPPRTLAERIARRGRETAEEIEERLAREAPLTVGSARVFEIRNDGALSEGRAAFLKAVDAAFHLRQPA